MIKLNVESSHGRVPGSLSKIISIQNPFTQILAIPVCGGTLCSIETTDLGENLSKELIAFRLEIG